MVQEWPAPANNFISPDWTLTRWVQRHPGPPGHLPRHRPRGFGAGRVLRPRGAHLRAGATELHLLRAGVEKFNQFNPGLANKLLEQAGWSMGSGGIREKNGKKLSFTYLDWANQAFGALIMQAVVPDAEGSRDQDERRLAAVGQFLPGYPKSAGLRLRVALVVADRRADHLQLIPTPAYNGNLPDLAAAFHSWQTADNEAQMKAAASKAQLIWAENLPKIPIVTRNRSGYTTRACTTGSRARPCSTRSTTTSGWTELSTLRRN